MDSKCRRIYSNLTAYFSSNIHIVFQYNYGFIRNIENSTAVMAIPVGAMILTMIIDIPYQFRTASQIYDLLPTNLLAATELWDNRLISVFGKYFANYQIAPIAYLIFTILLAVIGKIIYQKHQVSDR